MEYLYPYESSLPLEKLDPEVGQIATRGYRKNKYTINGIEKEVIVPGWFLEDDKDGKYGILDPKDQKQFHRNMNRARAEANNLLLPEEIKEIREGLGLTQEEAAAKIGGGKHAFQRYESGDVVPSSSLSHLLRILKKDPSKLNEILNFSAIPFEYPKKK